MSQFKELKNPLSANYLQFKESVFHDETFWLRFSSDPVTESPVDYMWFCHPIIARPLPEVPYPVVKSSLVNVCSNALKEILYFNNIRFECFHRIAVNLLPQQLEGRRSVIHRDHSFDYKHLIIYLDNSDGDTLMYNSKKQIIDRSSPKEDKVIMFNKCLHAGEFPVDHYKRTILVATFS